MFFSHTTLNPSLSICCTVLYEEAIESQRSVNEAVAAEKPFQERFTFNKLDAAGTKARLAKAKVRLPGVPSVDENPPF